MWRISFWLFFSIGYIIINNSIKADFNTYRPNRLHFLPYFFQSTLPVRGATTDSITGWETVRISIHAPRAGSDRQIKHYRAGFRISLHAPRAGSDN